MEAPFKEKPRSRGKQRHLALLISLLVLFIVSPFIVTHRFGVVILNLAGAAVLFSGAFAVSERRMPLVLGLFLSVGSVAIDLLIFIFPNQPLVMVSFCSLLLLLSFFSVNILRNVLRSGEVTADKIYGAVCVYLLIAYAWAFAYAIIETLQPGSFSGLKETGPTAHVDLVMQMRYFSFVIVTTVGFGDIAPLTPIARMFVTLEAVMGQMYIAILVARLVGLHIVYATNKQNAKD